MGVAMLFTRPLKLVELAFWPIVVVLQWASRVADIGRSDGETDASITEEELRSLIDIGEAEGEFDPGEADRLERVFRFGDRQVREVMTPRTEIVFVERGATLEQFLAVYRDHSHTRFPVSKGSTDNIVGILSSKDILRAMSSRAIPHDESVTDFTRDVYFVLETKRIAGAVRGEPPDGNQMAVAIDEFGGVAGLVTIRSLLEEAVGRVGEEGLSAEEEYEALGADTFQIDGGMDIREAMEELGIELPEGEFDTVAGFVLDALGHIPTEGETSSWRSRRWTASGSARSSSRRPGLRASRSSPPLQAHGFGGWRPLLFAFGQTLRAPLDTRRRSIGATRGERAEGASAPWIPQPDWAGRRYGPLSGSR